MRRTSARLAFIFIVFSRCSSAFALNPALDVSQYAHTSWKIRDGFFKAPITSFAQLPDGYLVLGTELGLVRFDGVRFVPWQPSPHQPLPSNTILSLLAARDGTLWIGTDQGLASWKDKTLTRHEALAGNYVGRLAEDRDGTIWLSRFATNRWTLCEIQKSRVACYGEDGGPGDGAIGVYEDRAGTLWVGTLTGVWRWKPGVQTFYRVPMASNGVQGLSEASDGALLIATTGGIRRIVADELDMAHPFSSSTQQSWRLLRDRHGSLWVGTSTAGLVHVHEGITDVFERTDGLSGDYVTALFEDREGSIWVATMTGVDRFRESAVVTYSENQGLSSGRVRSVLASSDGSLWIGTSDGLNRWRNGQKTVYRPRRAPGKTSGVMPFTSRNVREINGPGMPDAVDAMFEASDHRVWLSTTGGVGFLEHDRFTVVPGVPGGFVRGMFEDRQKNLWFAYPKAGVFRVNPATRDVEEFGLDTLKRNDPIMAMAHDRSGDGIWLGFFQGGVSYFAGGRVRTAYTTGDGLASGRISALYTEPSGTVWVAADGGVSRLKDGRIDTLTSRNGLPCDRVGWVMEDAARSLWLGMACGLVRIERREIDAWTGATQRLRTTVFDQTDGVTSFVNASFSSAVARSADGKLWFISPDGVSVVDPDRLPVNTLQPPVRIEQVVADRSAYATPDSASQLRLPALIRDVEISYTALSLIAPEKMRFRYKLENWDRDWQDVGTRRQAFYTDLRPGNYRFHVMASNNSGVWNETGASLNFAVAPAYYQTWWFRLLAMTAFVTLAAAGYQYRIRTVARQLNMRLEARVEERSRIARDFHDTLLQSFQGVLLKFQAATYLLPGRPDEARKTLEAVIEQASAAISEGRDAVHGLRSSTLVTMELTEAIGLLGQQIAADHGGDKPPDLRVEFQGKPRILGPLVRDEVYRIAGEAMRNAFRHASASRIEVDIHYDPRLFRLHVRDDGKGIDPAVLAAGGRKRHFGLRGMHERAHLVGGKLAVWSELQSGCEIELTIPASVAYAKSSRET